MVQWGEQKKEESTKDPGFDRDGRINESQFNIPSLILESAAMND